MIFHEMQLEELPSSLYKNRAQMPRIPALYVVLDDDNVVVYIGQTRNLWQRMKTHNLPFQNSYTVYWKEMKNTDERLEAEQQSIAYLHPQWNGGNVPLDVWSSCFGAKEV